MAHLTPEHPTALSPRNGGDDCILPDAPPQEDGGWKGGDSDESKEKPAISDVAINQEVKLEDMFNDEDSNDDEFPSSSPSNTKLESSPPANPINIGPSTKYTDPEIMLAFYQRLFPFRFLYQWLNHSVKPTTDFCHREFAFTLQNDAYLRYQSFRSGDLLRKQVLQLNPSRFEIGPVYSADPRDRKALRKSTAFCPIAKELVFDLDLTDYDEVRTCCNKANICHRCWSFVTMAIKVVDVALRDDFGFEHIIWVYSGRRGAHGWISDKRARDMDDSKRRALAGYLEVIKGGSQSGKKVNVKRPLHPHLARSLEILKPHFARDILEGQNPFATADGSERLLSLLPDAALSAALRKKWDAAPNRSSTSKWADIDVLAKSGASQNLDGKALLEAKQDIVLEYTYPRLDVEVSKKQIHLLKSPFVIHPGTGRVCVPINLDKVEKFDPLGVPTVTELLGEIDEYDGRQMQVDRDGEAEGEELKKTPDYEKTSLKPYVEYFKTYVASLLRAEKGGVKREREEEEKDGMEF
ncbi:MAG: hypothetical protein Q9163_005457 [Psora crenata]